CARKAHDPKERATRREAVELVRGFIWEILPDDHRHAETAGALFQRLLDDIDDRPQGFALHQAEGTFVRAGRAHEERTLEAKPREDARARLESGGDDRRRDEIDRDVHLEAGHDANRLSPTLEDAVGESELLLEPALLERPVPPVPLERRPKCGRP